MKIMIINGPNLNMLGIREPAIYGNSSYADLKAYIEKTAGKENIDVSFYQSNHEGDLVDCIQQCYKQYDGIVINAAAYSHTSIAILDALKTVSIPAVEVHLTDVSKRETFRQISYTGMGCLKTIMGKGFDGYIEAMLFLKFYLSVHTH